MTHSLIRLRIKVFSVFKDMSPVYYVEELVVAVVRLTY